MVDSETPKCEQQAVPAKSASWKECDHVCSAFRFDKQSKVIEIVDVWRHNQLSLLSLNSRSTCFSSIMTQTTTLSSWPLSWIFTQYVMLTWHNFNLECVYLLLAHGAPVKVKNNFGWSPLAEAISYGDRQISKLLQLINYILFHECVNIYLIDKNNFGLRSWHADQRKIGVATLFFEIISLNLHQNADISIFLKKEEKNISSKISSEFAFIYR